MLPIQFFAAPALSCSICKQICVSLWASTETGAVFVCTLPKQVLPVAPDFCFCVFCCNKSYPCKFCSEYECAQAVSRISCPEQFWQIFLLETFARLALYTTNLPILCRI
jgi:hypothetical protein